MDTLPKTPPAGEKSSPQNGAPTNPAAHQNGHAPASQPQADPHEETIPHDLPRPGPLAIIAMALLLVVLLAGLFLVGWLPHHSAAEQAAGDAAEVKNAIPVVTVVPPRAANPNTSLELPCDVRANRETDIYPRTSGYLKTRNVDIQDHVKAGQVLAEIDSPEVDAQLEQAKVGVSEAKARLGKVTSDLLLAKNTLDRYRSLNQKGDLTVTQQELQEKENAEAQAASALDEAQTQVKAADAAVDRLTVLQGFEKVTAPFDGTITTRNYDIGALLSPGNTSPGKEMFHLAETSPLRVLVNVPQVYAGQIKIHGPAYLTSNNAEFQGTVTRSSESIDPNTRTMLFELQFPNKDGRLYPGMYGMARLEVSQEHPTLLIPTNALRFDANGVQVAVVKDGKVHLQPIKAGNDMGTELEVVDGLTAESQVIVNPGERLAEGETVKITEPSKVAAKPTGAADAPKKAG